MDGKGTEIERQSEAYRVRVRVRVRVGVIVRVWFRIWVRVMVRLRGRRLLGGAAGRIAVPRARRGARRHAGRLQGRQDDPPVGGRRSGGAGTWGLWVLAGNGMRSGNPEEYFSVCVPVPVRARACLCMSVYCSRGGLFPTDQMWGAMVPLCVFILLLPPPPSTLLLHLPSFTLLHSSMRNAEDDGMGLEWVLDCGGQ
jgi:hypothetical protein